jgi:hypothetical protein
MGRLEGGGVLRTGAGMEIGSPESRGQVSPLLCHCLGLPLLLYLTSALDVLALCNEHFDTYIRLCSDDELWWNFNLKVVEGSEVACFRILYLPLVEWMEKAKRVLSYECWSLGRYLIPGSPEYERRVSVIRQRHSLHVTDDLDRMFEKLHSWWVTLCSSSVQPDIIRAPQTLTLVALERGV